MQMMALTADKRSVPLLAGNHLIYTYLMEEVIGGLDDKLKGFLIETAALTKRKDGSGITGCFVAGKLAVKGIQGCFISGISIFQKSWWIII